MLEDPIRSAAEGYIDLILTTPFEPDARVQLLKLLSSHSRAVTPNMELARQNAVRFVQEAAKEARARGVATVDVAAVQAAWIRLCPGFYPFC